MAVGESDEMDDLEKVTVAEAFVEYTAAFAETAFGLGENWGRLHQAMVQALGPWGLGPKGISFRKDPANLSEVHVSYRLPDSRFVFGVGVDSANFSISNPVWEDVPRFLPAIERGLAAIRNTINVSTAKQNISLAMHLRLRTKSSQQIVQQFVRTPRLMMPDEETKDCALTVHTDRGSYSLEPSLRLVGGLFVGFDRDYPGQKPLAEIAEDVRRTEDHVLIALGLTLANDNVPATK